MIVFANGNGDILKIVPEDVKQGSNKASIIYFVCPTGDNTVNIAFTLPNGKTRPQRVMTRVVDYTQIPQLTDTLGNGYFVWKYELKDALTAYSGQVDVQIFVTAQDGEIVSTPGFTFNVIKGVAPIEPPKDSDSYKDLISYVTSLFYGKYDKATGVDITDRKVLVKNDADTMASAITPSMVMLEDSQCQTFYDTTKITAMPKGENKSVVFNFPNENGTFATREWVQENGGGGSGIDVQINGTSIVEDGVANIPVSSTTQYSLIKVGEGLSVSESNGKVNIFKAKNSEIDAKTNSYRPIVPANLDYAVKVGLTTNKEILGPDEKAAAQAWLGVDNKVDKITGITSTAKAYVKNAGGTQGSLDITQTVMGNAIVQRTLGGAIIVSDNPAEGIFAVNRNYVDNAVANAGGGTLYQHNIQVFVQHSDTDENAFGFEFALFNTQSTAFGKDELFVYLNKMSGIPISAHKKYWINKEGEFLAGIRYYSDSGFETENGYITWNDEYSVVADIVIDM